MNYCDFSAASLALNFPFSIQAQSYPSKPIRYIVPVAAGSVNDMIQYQIIVYK
jgi:tripartite-type tricarboxylate transporter receptor subunit TctC